MPDWTVPEPAIVILGVAQDGGHPQTGCRLDCCAPAWADPALGHLCACIGVLDPATQGRWMLDCTPDFPAQLRALDEVAPVSASPGLDGVLLTHGHIGHYTGLMHLGREQILCRGG